MTTTRTDTTVNSCTIRTWREDEKFIRADVFNASGWKVGSYKTEAGALRAANRSR